MKTITQILIVLTSLSMITGLAFELPIQVLASFIGLCIIGIDASTSDLV